jgi:hypothetical protein
MEVNKIIVTGDVALDTNVYKGIKKSPEIKEKEYGTSITETKGGSYLLFEIISRTAQQKIGKIENSIKTLTEKARQEPTFLEESGEKVESLKKEKLKWETFICQYGLKEEIFDEGKFPPALRTYAAWGLKEFNVPKSYQGIYGDKTNAWRVTEMIGWGEDKKEKQEKNKEVKSSAFFYRNYVLGEKQNPDILVFDDGGNNFRNDVQSWTDLLFEKSEGNREVKKTKNIAQVILKTAHPLCHGSLFQELTISFKNKLTIITSIDELRKEDVLISKGVSWEQTALDLVFELRNNRAINQLLQCKRLIVTLQSEGALYIEMDEAGEIVKCRLSFDPEHLEGEWVTTQKIEGDVFGLMVCFTSAIAYAYQEALLKTEIEKEFKTEAAVTSSLSAMRRYKISGHQKNDNNPTFPYESVCSEIISPNTQFASAFVPIPCRAEDPEVFLTQNWTILEGNYKPKINEKPEPLFDTAFRFALFGNNELANTPFLKVNKLLTYDRLEIEALHNVKNLIADYINEEKPDKPLSLAVFGMPGSGKSFAVKQLAKSLELPILEFNLSQFADGDLEGAFHLVRDKVLEGKPPVVFWDEFDSQAYKWLQYLLAPMQDGKFQSGQIIHPIGKSIFIFAGGTSYTFDTFGIQKPEKPDPGDLLAVKEYEIVLNSFNDFALKKGPDFKSRLSGYINIQGPNQLEMLDTVGKIMKDEYGNVIYNEDDIQFPVRRALFIRGLCGKKNNEELVIDHGLLHALIKTRKFTHGSRSLEKVLNYLKTKNSNKLQRSNLPTVSILNMLVDNDFIGLLDEDKFFEFQAFKIAPQIHQNWMKIGDTQGWKLEYHKDYNYLPAHMKDENVEAARRIQKALDVLKPDINLEIVHKSEAEFFENVDFHDIIKIGDNLDRLAIEEHKGWVETKEKSGWVYNETRNDDRKMHNCLLEWVSGKTSKLPLKEQNKDKDAIQNFPMVLDAAGFVIIEKKL